MTGIFSKSFKVLRTYSCNRSVSYIVRKIDVFTGRHLFPKKDQGKSLKFELTYVDESFSEQSKPVVLFLPGTPGTYHDFDSQIEFFMAKGIRVIAPNFPEFPAMRNCSPTFRNTPVNRAALLADFLKTIGIDRVDVLVSHSSAYFSALRLFNGHDKPIIKSMAFLNPTCLRINTANPFWLFKFMGELAYWRPGYAFYELFGMWLLPKIVLVDVPNINDPLLAMTAVRSYKIIDVIQDLKLLRNRQQPLLFVFSGNDKIIPKSSAHEVLSILGSTEEDFWVYNKDGKLTRKGNTDTWVQAMYFEKGSHFTSKKFPDVINWSLLGLLQRSIEKKHRDIEPNTAEETCRSK